MNSLTTDIYFTNMLRRKQIKGILQRLDLLEEETYNNPPVIQENPEMIISFECWDRAVSTLSREDKVPNLEDVLEWAYQIQKFVTTDK